ncbi:MAG: hypothetical protein ACJAYU_002887 [Bradymonadia bacterium]|jgi:hypothetical protein
MHRDRLSAKLFDDDYAIRTAVSGHGTDPIEANLTEPFGAR